MPPVDPTKPQITQQLFGTLDISLSLDKLLSHFAPDAQWSKATIADIDKLLRLIPFQFSYPLLSSH